MIKFDGKIYLTAAELAKLLSVSPEAIQGRIKKGTLVTANIQVAKRVIPYDAALLAVKDRAPKKVKKMEAEKKALMEFKIT